LIDSCFTIDNKSKKPNISRFLVQVTLAIHGFAPPGFD